MSEMNKTTGPDGDKDTEIKKLKLLVKKQIAEIKGLNEKNVVLDRKNRESLEQIEQSSDKLLEAIDKQNRMKNEIEILKGQLSNQEEFGRVVLKLQNRVVELEKNGPGNQEKAVEELKKQIAVLKKENEELNNELWSLQADDHENGDKEENKSELETENGFLREEIKNIEEKNASLEKQMKTILDENEDLKKELWNSQADDENQDILKQKEELESKIAELENLVSENESNKNKYEEEITFLKKQIEKLKEEVANANEDLWNQEEDERISELKSEIEKLKNESISQINKLEDEKSLMSIQIQELESDLDRIQSELKDQQQRAILSESKNKEYENSIKALDQEKISLIDSHNRQISEIKQTFVKDHEKKVTQIEEQHSEHLELLEYELQQEKEKNVVFSGSIEDLNKRIRSQDEELTRVTRSLANSQEKNSEELLQINEEKNNLKLVIHKLEQEINDLKSNYIEAIDKQNLINEEIGKKDTMIENLESINASLTENIGKLKENLDNQIKDKENQDCEKCSSLSQQINDLEYEIEDLKSQIISLNAYKQGETRLKKQLEKLQNDNSELESRISLMAENTNEEISELKNQITAIEYENQRLKESNLVKDSEIVDLQGQLSEIQDKSTENNNLVQNNQKLYSEIQTLRETISTQPKNEDSKPIEELTLKYSKLQKEYSDLKKKYRANEQIRAELEASQLQNEYKMMTMTEVTAPVPIPQAQPDDFKIPYLKSTLQQFFVQDRNTQEKMISIILSFIGCEEEDIHTATNGWNQNHPRPFIEYLFP